MLSYTAAQIALIELARKTGKCALSIGITSPIRLCSGQQSVEIAGNTFSPWPCDLPEIPITDLVGSQHTIKLANRSELDSSLVLSQENYADPFDAADIDITYYWLLRQPGEQGWTTIDTLTVACERTTYDPAKNELQMYILGSAGYQNRSSGWWWTRRCPMADGDFKSDPLCSYAGGETWCDGTLTRCTALGMTARILAALHAPDPDAVYQMGPKDDGLQFPHGGRTFSPPPPGEPPAPIPRVLPKIDPGLTGPTPSLTRG